MEFKNKENEKVVLSDKRTVWLSRAVAIVGTVCLIKDGTPYFLIGQRGEGAADFHGLWNIPCGYLDWNETTGEAFIREVWEECGVNIQSLLDDKKSIKIDFSKTPWDVNSRPSENRQNVCVHHALVAIVDELPTPEIQNIVEHDEVSDVKWVSINNLHNYEYAFKHQERLNFFIKTVLYKSKTKYFFYTIQSKIKQFISKIF